MTRANPAPTTSRRGLFSTVALAGLAAAGAAPAPAAADVLELRRLDAEAVRLAAAAEATPDDHPDYDALIAAAAEATRAAEARIQGHPARGRVAAWARARSCLRHAVVTGERDLIAPLKAIVEDLESR